MPYLSINGEFLSRSELRKSRRSGKRSKGDHRQRVTRKHELQPVREVSRDYQRWRKSEAFQIWFKRQWKAQDARCFYCLCSLRGRRPNVEHVVPRSLRGTNSRRNLVLSCATCNMEKGARAPTS